MAVIVRKKTRVAGKDIELRAYEPSGSLSREDRLRADRLDAYLQKRLPEIAREVLRDAGENPSVRKWHALGLRLRAVAGDRGLVASADIDSGALWRAVWQYLPDTVKPEGAAEEESYADKQHKRKDHLWLCYEIGAFSWPDIEWIRRWDDWHQIAFRPSLIRDPRLLRALSEAITSSERYPSREEFRTIVKLLGEEFPTRKARDTTMLPEDTLVGTVSRVVTQAMR